MTDSIFEPEVSVVAHGLEGKVIMLMAQTIREKLIIAQR